MNANPSAHRAIAARSELRRARAAVAREYARRHGRTATQSLVDELLAGAWYRLSDAAENQLRRAIRHRRRA